MLVTDKGALSVPLWKQAFSKATDVGV